MTPDSPNFDNILALAASVDQIHHQMAETYSPIVQNIIQSRTRDQQRIEHTLDHLLGCACIPEGLTLYRSLCRYYNNINPVAAAHYVGFYREMWDSEESDDPGPEEEA